MELFRRYYSNFNRDASSKPLIKRIAVNTKMFRYLSNRKLLSADGIYSIYAPIVLLGFSRCPPAIRFFIVTVALYPIKSHSFRHLTHIFKKIGKAIKPTITYFDTATTVIGIKFGIWIKASLLHSAPRLIGCATGKSCLYIAKVQEFCSLRGLLISKTPARADFTAVQMVDSDGLSISAIALAKPVIARARKVRLNNYKHMESFVGDIIGHNKILQLGCNWKNTSIIWSI